MTREHRVVFVGAVLGISALLWAFCDERVSPLVCRSAAAAHAVKLEEGDNSQCLCCHMDFDGEDIVEKHLAKKITCRSCHGPSEPHRQDETLRTKPDLLWGRAEVRAFCRQCHQTHKKPAAVEEFRQKWLGKARPNGRFISKDAVCTDCHGEHTVPPEE